MTKSFGPAGTSSPALLLSWEVSMGILEDVIGSVLGG
jgi:hypothetical protein